MTEPHAEPRDPTRLAAAALLRGEALAGPHLVVTEGPEAGRRLPLRDAQTLGRGRAADLRLADPGISRLHARVSRERGRLVATDLGSRNGLRVNGRRCRRPRGLEIGDELALGATRMVVEAGVLEGPASGPRPPPTVATEPPSRSPRLLLAAATALLGLAALLLALPCPWR